VSLVHARLIGFAFIGSGKAASFMNVVIGLVVVIGSILTGYTMHNGKVAALMQYTEFIIIGGSALGSVILGYSLKSAILVFKGCLGLLKGNPYKKQTFLELLQAMYDLFMLARKDGLLALERHIENPRESDIFKNYPGFLRNHHAVDFLCDTLKLVMMGGTSVYDLSDMMDMDMEAQHQEAMKVTNILSTIGDSMPGFGIVAAVLGVVITMQAIGGPPEEIGEKVGAALVGTFLGVLMAYGIVNPLSKACEGIVHCEGQYMAGIKNAVVAFARGDVPLICIEYARRNIEPELRPGFAEMESTVKKRKGDKASASGDGQAEKAA
jgi:chemotaxis protein MotA